MTKGFLTKIEDDSAESEENRDDKVDNMANAVRDIENLLYSLLAADPDAAEHLAPLLAHAREMNAQMGDIVAAKKSGDVEKMSSLLQELATTGNALGVKPETDPGYLLLQDALDDGDESAIADALGQLGDLNRWLGKSGMTPLIMAMTAKGRSAARVKLFLDHGARADFTAEDGYSSLHAMVDYMWHDDADIRTIIMLLVDDGADLEAHDNYGWTPLARATIEGSIDEMHALLLAGADPNTATSDQGPTIMANKCALLLAASSPDKVQLLLDQGADITASGIETFIESELMLEDPSSYVAYYDGLRGSQRLIVAARRH